MGRALAAKVRTETYNAMLAAAKRGLKPTDPKNNTWEIRPSDEITVGSNYVKLAERAKMYLTRVVSEHPGTPWAMLAKRELDDPLGWTWKDSYTPQEAKKAEPKVVNNAKAAPRAELREQYEATFMTALKRIATTQKNVNVLEHMLGFISAQLDKASRQELLSHINDYHQGRVPLIVPLTLIRHYVRLFDVKYLRDQVYLVQE